MQTLFYGGGVRSCGLVMAQLSSLADLTFACTSIELSRDRLLCIVIGAILPLATKKGTADSLAAWHAGAVQAGELAMCNGRRIACRK